MVVHAPTERFTSTDKGTFYSSLADHLDRVKDTKQEFELKLSNRLYALCMDDTQSTRYEAFETIREVAEELMVKKVPVKLGVWQEYKP